jgi:hypothetical protein
MAGAFEKNQNIKRFLIFLSPGGGVIDMFLV